MAKRKYKKKYKRKSAITGLSGVEAIKKDLQKFLKTVEYKSNNIVWEEAAIAAAHAKALTPFKTGKLEGSVYVRVSRDKRRPGYRLGARAHNPDDGFDYAWVQHENINYRHPIKGQAKYIEIPFRMAVERIKRRFDEIRYGG